MQKIKSELVRKYVATSIFFKTSGQFAKLSNWNQFLYSYILLRASSGKARFTDIQ